MIRDLTATALRILTDDVSNPLDGVTPSLDVFGITFKGKVQLILGGVWALALAGTVIAMLVAGASWAWARNTGHEDALMQASGKFRNAAVAFGVVAGASLIIGAILYVVK